MERKTPLYDLHVSLGGTMVPFGGYLLPVQYPAGIRKEHMAVREGCGLFDVSHMGEFTLRGSDAAGNLNRILTNRYDDLTVGKARYSPMCYEDGGTVDDLIVYRRGEEEFFLIVNADNREKDFNWIREHLSGDADLGDVSEDLALIALQGPKAEEILSRSAGPDSIPAKNYSAVFDARICGNIPCMIGRTGYTGEDGFEICLPKEHAETVFRRFLEEGEAYGILPCGLGARDTLRLEAGMPLYGHELSREISPVEAGLDFTVNWGKPDFMGRTALMEQKNALAEPGKGIRKRVGILAEGRGIFREHCPVLIGEEEIGVTTSGTFLPYRKVSGAMAMVPAECASPGAAVEVLVRGRKIGGTITPLPFVLPARKRK